MNENPPTANLPPTVPKANGTKLARLNSPWFQWPAAAGLAVILYLGLSYLIGFLTHESTDDAFIAGHVVSIAPRVDGQVLAVPVLDNQFVHSNDLLVELDPADYSITVAQKEAATVSQDANLRTMIAAYELMRTKVATAEAAARVAKADADAAGATAKKTQADFDRAADLLKQNTISQQEFDSAQAANTKAQADWKSALDHATEQLSKVDEADRTLAATFAEKDMALAQFNESETNVSAAKLNLSYTKLYAPVDGRVTRKTVETGDYVQAGQTLLSIVPKEVWVVANFKESQLKHMRPGQHARVAIDALDESFAAHVDSVQAGSGAAFSLLPPENATGNYVKVVQRVPVKIVFDEPLPADHTIGPGLSVVPVVQVSSFRLPEWVIGLLALVLTVAAMFVFRFALNRKLNGK